jgi:hypothetical protein
MVLDLGTRGSTGKLWYLIQQGRLLSIVQSDRAPDLTVKPGESSKRIVLYLDDEAEVKARAELMMRKRHCRMAG